MNANEIKTLFNIEKVSPKAEEAVNEIWCKSKELDREVWAEGLKGTIVPLIENYNKIFDLETDAANRTERLKREAKEREYSINCKESNEEIKSLISSMRKILSERIAIEQERQHCCFTRDGAIEREIRLDKICAKLCDIDGLLY